MLKTRTSSTFSGPLYPYKHPVNIMSKYFYIALASVGLLLIIAFTLLSYIDKKMLDPSRKLSENPTADLSPEPGTEPYQMLSSKKYGDNPKESVPPST